MTKLTFIYFTLLAATVGNITAGSFGRSFGGAVVGSFVGNTIANAMATPRPAAVCVRPVTTRTVYIKHNNNCNQRYQAEQEKLRANHLANKRKKQEKAVIALKEKELALKKQQVELELIKEQNRQKELEIKLLELKNKQFDK